MIPKKLVRRSIATHPLSTEESKANARYAIGGRSLPQINEVEGTASVVEAKAPIRGKIQRKPSSESIGASPYATGKDHIIPRSMSVPKIKTKGGHSGKPGAVPKGRSSPRPESASIDLSLNRSAQAAWAGDLEQLQKSALLAKDSFHMSFQSLPRTPVHMPPKGAKSLKFREKKPAFSLPESQMSPSGLEEIENALDKAVQSLQKADFRGLLRVYHRYFSEVIRTSGALGVMLSKFKEGYETLAEELLEKHNREVATLQSEIIALQNNVLREVEEKKALIRKFEKLSRENIDLSQACENFESKCNEYQEKLYDIANTQLDHYPPSQATYRLLVSELESYKGWKVKVTKELKISQSKEKKLIQLVHALKKKGYPVEEVYNAEFKAPATSKRSRVSDEAESERLVSGLPQARKRPENVPALDLDTVEPDIDSEESDMDSSLQCTEMEFSLRKTLSDSSTHTRTECADRSAASSIQDDQNKVSQDFKAFSAALRLSKLPQ